MARPFALEPALFLILTAALAATPAETCAVLLDRLADEQQAALVAMGGVASDTQRKELRAGFVRAEAACAAMDPAKLACALAAPNALAGVADCALNADKGNGARIDLPFIGFRTPFLGSSAPGGTPEELAAARQALLGAWTDGQGAWERGWTFSDDGAAVQLTTNNGVAQPVAGTWELVSPHVVRVKSAGGQTNWSFDVAGGWLTMGSSNEVLLPAVTSDEAKIAISGNIFLVRGLGSTPTCVLYDGAGRPAERCAVTVDKSGPEPVLSFVGRYGHRVDTGAPMTSDLTYRFVLHAGRPFLASPTGHMVRH